MTDKKHKDMANFDFQQTAPAIQELLNSIPDKATKEELEQLRELYEALTQSEIIPVPSADWPVSDPQKKVIYRVAGDESYTDYMWNGAQFVPMATYDNTPTDIPIVGSTDVITAGGVANHGSAFDISEYNKNGATLATYADLSAALAAVPSTVQKGGMSIKFVQSADNKYVQYFLTKDEWSAIEDDWEKLNLKEEVSQLGQDINSVGQNYIPRCTYNSDGSISGNPDWFIGYDYIPVKNGDTIVWNPGSSNQGGNLILYNSAKERIGYYAAIATERTVVLSNANATFIRPSFAMDNLSSAKIIKNGVEVWSPAIREMGVVPKEKQTNLALGFITGEKSILYSIQNGTPGNYTNANCVVVRGRNTVVLPGIPGHKYRLKFNKTPHEGYNFYFDWGAYTTDSPTSFVTNRTRTTGYVEDKEFVLNSNEHGFAILIAEKTSASSDTYSPLRESDFSADDICILDVTDSRFDVIENTINTKLMAGAKYSAFSPVLGKYVTTNSNNEKIINSLAQVSYIEIPVSSIGKRICLTGFSYTPSPAAGETYTAILFFDTNDHLLSREYYPIDGIMSLNKPNGAVTCYIDAPVAHIGELSIFSDAGVTDSIQNTSGTIMTRFNSSENLKFDEHSLTIGQNGFSYFQSGTKYDITGEQDFVVDFGINITRRYLCLNLQALDDGKRAFADVLSVFDNTVPGMNYVILLDFYNGHPQDGLLLPHYFNAKQDADTIGSPIIVDFETKGKVFSALYANAQNVVSFLFFTDPHICKVGDGFMASYMPMMKKIQQFYQSLPLDFVLSGGDWLNNSDTQAMACYKLGNITQQLKTRLSPYYQMVGNHDTNYQGVAPLSQDTINAIMFNDFGKAYYRVERHNCALYVFDSGTDGRTSLSSYDKEQLNWFAESLVAEQKDNIVIASHIIIEGSQGSSYLAAFATAIEQIAEAYNSRGSVTIDGVTYVFTEVTGNGRIRCFIGGHTHYDYVNTEEAIPVFITLNAVATNDLFSERPNPRFDLILVDFAEGKLHSIRVGDGENRTIDLA